MEKGFTIKVHGNGFVRYVDHMGGDLDILESARVSTQNRSKGLDQDWKLMRYLFSHAHSSPFEMVKLKLHLKLPIFVMRQYIRHRMQNVNEQSARYSELPSDFYTPRPEQWRLQDTKNKQGSLGSLEPGTAFEATRETEAFYEQAYSLYQHHLKRGIAREQARIVLPVGIYTEAYVCWDMNNLVKYFRLRDDSHAQGEHQDYAQAVKEIARYWFPWTMACYDRFEFSIIDRGVIPVPGGAGHPPDLPPPFPE